MNLESYNTNVNVNYKDKKELYISEVFYRENLIEVFNKNIDNIIDLNFFTDLEKCIQGIYQDLPKDNENFNNLLKKVSSNFYLSENKSFGFLLLFGYDYFYLVHKLLTIYKKHKYLDENIINEIYKNI